MPPRKVKDLLLSSLPEDTIDPPPPAKKIRGRPKKVLPEKDVSAPEPPKEAPMTKKRTRNGKATPPADKEDIPSTQKRQRRSANTTTNTGGTRTKGKVVAKRDPLPAREARNEHPGAREGVGPAARRKPSEVAAERDSVRCAAEEQIQRGKEAAEFLAQMQLAQEKHDAAMEIESEQRLSALLRGHQHGNQDVATESDAKEFDVDPGGDSAESESPVEVVAEKGSQTFRKH